MGSVVVSKSPDPAARGKPRLKKNSGGRAGVDKFTLFACLAITSWFPRIYQNLFSPPNVQQNYTRNQLFPWPHPQYMLNNGVLYATNNTTQLITISRVAGGCGWKWERNHINPSPHTPKITRSDCWNSARLVRDAWFCMSQRRYDQFDYRWSMML